ncbi:MAG TPA: NUDIX domain-containing protein [Bacillota bacterium]|jgi:8-oxo-dGTP diphosphatase|nr:NUDIX domain-containing protein [Bacillota bacterium]HOL11239.1 NUDIX domain-containing protein [Bacillota bacterium]HPO97430.1 NUDIX domain-containing protein [Bacillota bacterium]
MSNSTIKDKQGLTEEQFLEQYDVSKYDRPSVTVDMLILTIMDEEKENYRKLPEKKLKLLLIKRGEHPYIGQWALPGGFVGVNESIDAAAIRELKSETNIDNIYMEQLYTWGDPGRDPRTRVISCSYMALVDSTALKIKAGDDAADAAWFEFKYKIVQEHRTELEKGHQLERLIKIELVNELATLTATVKVTETVKNRSTRYSREIVDSQGIAFDHAVMMEYAIERLRNKLEYTDLAFSLVPELFTLTELQKVYEVILGKELLAAAFRRKIANMVIETEQYTRDAGHRPSQLFRFNPNWRYEK